MELISMTDFVLGQKEKFSNDNDREMWDYLKAQFRYAEFLKQPLTLGMFLGRCFCK
jgi:hypothetical protein